MKPFFTQTLRRAGAAGSIREHFFHEKLLLVTKVFCCESYYGIIVHPGVYTRPCCMLCHCGEVFSQKDFKFSESEEEIWLHFHWVRFHGNAPNLFMKTS